MLQGMDLEAAKLAVDSAKDTQLITLNKLLTPPELGTGSRSGSESDDDAEAHLEPYAYEHDAARRSLAQDGSVSQRQGQGKQSGAEARAAAGPSEPGKRQAAVASPRGSESAKDIAIASKAHAASHVEGQVAAAAQKKGTGNMGGASAVSKQLPLDQSGSSTTSTQDVRAAEAVVRSTMLPTQVTSHADISSR